MPLELYDELTRWIDELAGRRQVAQPPLRSLRASATPADPQSDRVIQPTPAGKIWLTLREQDLPAGLGAS